MSHPEAGKAANDDEVPMIDVSNLGVSLGGTQILADVDLSIQDGRFVGLIGPNGAGKSTLLRTMSGYLEPDAGTVRIAGENVHALSSRAASRLVAAVPQETGLSFSFPVRDVVAMGRTPHRGRLERSRPVDDDAVERALVRTATTAFADRSIDAVSGGERQRVILARALAQETPVLLLDEPTASLDINHQVRTLELVTDLVAAGKTVVAAIHDLNLAAHYCDELVLLAEGKVLDTGTPSAVLTEDALRAAFDARAVVTRHPVTGAVYVTALPERTETGEAGHVHVIGGGGTASRLLYVLAAAGYTVSVGVLNEGDSDLETARSLGLDAISIEPFGSITSEAKHALRKRVRSADVTVIADVEIGVGNLANLVVADESERLVVVEERPFPERNYAGTDAALRYDELRARARVVSPERVLNAVRTALDQEDGEATNGTIQQYADREA